MEWCTRSGQTHQQEPEQGWKPIKELPDDAEFIIGAWTLPSGEDEAGELYRDLGTDAWFNIMNGRVTPHHFQLLPDPPSQILTQGQTHEGHEEEQSTKS